MLATPVPAPAADGLFAPGAFDRLSVGDALLYRHRRVAPAVGRHAAVTATGTLRLTRVPAPQGSTLPAVTLTFSGARVAPLAPCRRPAAILCWCISWNG